MCDLRENYYESRGVGCYLFRIDVNYVVDATLQGNAARFINHSCEVCIRVVNFISALKGARGALGRF